jgi:hypothetical protein
MVANAHLNRRTQITSSSHGRDHSACECLSSLLEFHLTRKYLSDHLPGNATTSGPSLKWFDACSLLRRGSPSGSAKAPRDCQGKPGRRGGYGFVSAHRYRQSRVVAFPERGQQLAARLAERPHGPDEATYDVGAGESLPKERGSAGPRNASKRSSSQPAHFFSIPVWTWTTRVRRTSLCSSNSSSTTKVE